MLTVIRLCHYQITVSPRCELAAAEQDDRLCGQRSVLMGAGSRRNPDPYARTYTHTHMNC